MSQKVLIVGATSGIATAVARRLAARGDALVLAGRRVDELERLATDLRVRHGCTAAVLEFDVEDLDGATAKWEAARAALGGHVDGVLLCQGFMADEAEARADAALIRRTIDVNFTSAVALLEVAARDLEGQGAGWIAAVSSVAGDRGRQSNYLYGASKAGLSAYLQGLRNRLFSTGVQVLTVKPGFVYTAMTQRLLDPSSPLVVAPDRVAKDVVRALEKGKDVLYTPWFWWGIMAVIRAVPERLFKRLKL